MGASIAATVRAAASRRLTTEAVALAAVALLAIVSSAVDAVIYAKMSRKMKGHEWALSQVIYTWSTNLVLWPVIAFRHWRGQIPASNWKFPKRYLAFIAFMGTGGNLLYAFPSTYLPGALRAVLAQLTTPIMVVLSMWILKSKFTVQHYIACAIIVTAGVLALVPRFTASDSQGSHVATGAGLLPWVVVMLLYVMIPKPVYTEKYCKSADLDVLFFRGHYALFEALIGLCLAPVVLLPIPGQQHVSPAELPGFLGNAFLCFAGDQSAAEEGGDCPGSWQVWILYMGVNVCTDLSTIAVTKYGSAVLSRAIGALTLPLTAFLYGVRPLAGPAAQSGFSGWTIVAIFVATLGLILYGNAPEASSQRQVSLTRSQAGHSVDSAAQHRAEVDNNENLGRALHLPRRSTDGAMRPLLQPEA